MDKITEKLFAMQDTKYRDFQVKLIPGADPDTFIGTRTPQLRSLAKEMLRSGGCRCVSGETSPQIFR